MSDFTRIGIAFSKPRGADRRRDQYGILRSSEGSLYARYEGYRYIEANGSETQVGLPLAGPSASWAQPLTDFKPEYFEATNFFAGSHA